LLADAGATPRASDWPFFGACQGSTNFSLLTSNCRQIMTGAREAVIGLGGLPANRFDTALSAYDRWSRDPGAALWYCTFWAEGVREARA
jgi:hypothetical protein